MYYYEGLPGPHSIYHSSVVQARYSQSIITVSNSGRSSRIDLSLVQLAKECMQETIRQNVLDQASSVFFGDRQRSFTTLYRYSSFSVIKTKISKKNLVWKLLISITTILSSSLLISKLY